MLDRNRRHAKDAIIHGTFDTKWVAIIGAAQARTELPLSLRR